MTVERLAKVDSREVYADDATLHNGYVDGEQAAYYSAPSPVKVCRGYWQGCSCSPCNVKEYRIRTATNMGEY
jgi:hypothetical protein